MSRSSSGVASHVVSRALVKATKRRDTALFDTARSGMSGRSGSRVRGYFRVVTPTAIASSVWASSGSWALAYAKLGSVSSSPVTLRARKRGSTMRRPPSTTSLGALPPRYAWRSGSGTFFGPQSCMRSCSISVWNTCCPAVRQSPKNAVFASARTASSGNGTCTVATGERAGAFPEDDPVRLLFMAAPFRFGLSNHHPYRMAEGAAALLQLVSSTSSGTSWSVKVGNVCVDKYEASVWQIPVSNTGLIKNVQKGKADLDDLTAGGAVQLGCTGAPW